MQPDPILKGLRVSESRRVFSISISLRDFEISNELNALRNIVIVRVFYWDNFVKTTADVRQVAASISLKRPRERPTKMGLLEVFFLDQEMNFRIVKKPLEFNVK